jgi:prepilin-type N-terminal cleavage/methylation domain-containing protein
MHRTLSRRGFTIVEVVVAIAVIALLMGLLFPVLGAVKRTARNTLCMSNIRNFVAADLAYMTVHQRLPPMSPYVPTSIGVDRIRQIGQYCGQRVPEGDAFSWPRREVQPDWINCPCAVHSGYAEGPTVGGGVYTGYAYYGGLADSQIVSSGLGTVVNPGHACDSRASERGVMWADILAEFPTTEERRFEIFHVRPRTVQYTDFRFHAREVDAIHRGWSDGSVERVKLNLEDGSPDQRLQTFLGNYYF